MTGHFKTRGAGAEYILESIPDMLQKFIGVDIKGYFTADELKILTETTYVSTLSGVRHLMTDVFDGISLNGLMGLV